MAPERIWLRIRIARSRPLISSAEAPNFLLVPRIWRIALGIPTPLSLGIWRDVI